MELLLKWRKECPDDKTMIVSQWTSVLDLCSAYLNEQDFPHVSFTGAMSLPQRGEAVKTFKDNDDISVLLSTCLYSCRMLDSNLIL